VSDLLLDTHTALWFFWDDGLAAHHKDPFDRLLIAQGMLESIPIVSADAVLIKTVCSACGSDSTRASS
jgi:PIN domain nuclease of toxin-antitoxin system